MEKKSEYDKLRGICEGLLKVTAPWAVLKWCRPPAGHPSWDGEVMYAIAPKDPSGAIHQAHEVSHLLVCAKRRRRLPEFGLGVSPVNPIDESKAPRVVSLKRAWTEEEAACSVHIAIVAGIYGLDEVEIIAEALNYSLETLAFDVSRSAIQRLEEALREVQYRRLGPPGLVASAFISRAKEQILDATCAARRVDV